MVGEGTGKRQEKKEEWLFNSKKTHISSNVQNSPQSFSKYSCRFFFSLSFLPHHFFFTQELDITHKTFDGFFFTIFFFFERKKKIKMLCFHWKEACGSGLSFFFIHRFLTDKKKEDKVRKKFLRTTDRLHILDLFRCTHSFCNPIFFATFFSKRVLVAIIHSLWQKYKKCPLSF